MYSEYDFYTDDEIEDAYFEGLIDETAYFEILKHYYSSNSYAQDTDKYLTAEYIPKTTKQVNFKTSLNSYTLYQRNQLKETLKFLRLNCTGKNKYYDAGFLVCRAYECIDNNLYTYKQVNNYRVFGVYNKVTYNNYLVKNEISRTKYGAYAGIITAQMKDKKNILVDVSYRNYDPYNSRHYKNALRPQVQKKYLNCRDEAGYRMHLQLFYPDKYSYKKIKTEAGADIYSHYGFTRWNQDIEKYETYFGPRTSD
ncbi:hypothetical protein ACFL4S_01800, partial [bacterium]